MKFLKEGINRSRKEYLSTILTKHLVSPKFLISDNVVKESFILPDFDNLLLISLIIESFVLQSLVSISPSICLLSVFSTNKCNKAKSLSKGFRFVIESRSIKYSDP